MNHGKQANAQPKEFFQTLMELAELMKTDPQGIDVNLSKAGEGLVGIFYDTNFRSQIQNLRKQKIHAIEMAARDIAEGVMTLRSSTIGVTFREGKLGPFVTPRGSSPDGNVVFSLNWRNARDFHRADPATTEVTQEQVNAALYYLSVILSQTI